MVTRFAVLLPMALLLGACNSTPRVRDDADARITMANYQTYVFEQVSEDGTPGGAAFRNPLNQKRLRAAVETNLAKFGMRPAPEGTKADSYVTVAMGTRQTVESQPYPVRFGFGFGTGWGGYRRNTFGSLAWNNDALYTYNEGRVTVDLFDAKTREPLWHAAVEQDLTSFTGKDAEMRINKVVDAMFTKFPAKYPGAAK